VLANKRPQAGYHSRAPSTRVVHRRLSGISGGTDLNLSGATRTGEQRIHATPSLFYRPTAAACGEIALEMRTQNSQQVCSTFLCVDATCLSTEA